MTMSEADAMAWAQWASRTAYAMLAESFEGTKLTPEGEPPVPVGVTGMAVAWWIGDKLRASAWEQDMKPSVKLLAVLVEQSCEGDDDSCKPIARRELESLRVTVALLRSQRRKLTDETTALQDGEALLASNKFVFPEELQRTTLAQARASAKKGAQAVQVVCGSYQPPAAAAAPPGPAAPKKRGGWGLKIGLALFVALLLYIRYMNATYDVRWDAFVANYGLLGLPVDAPLSDVKKAYHRMSMTQHPDKMGAACDEECNDHWVAVSNAYAEIKDYHSGRLRLVGRPTRFDEDFA